MGTLTVNRSVQVLVFRHDRFQHLGLIAGSLERHGIGFRYVDLASNPEQDPPVTDADGLIFLGGPMFVNDDLPYLRREEQFIVEAVAQRKPVLGICLGSQLVAHALGGRVYWNPVSERGGAPVYWTEAGTSDPLLGGLPSPEMIFHWHGQTFDLPPSAEWLAYSSECRNQAFRVGDLVYGLQFHLEASPDMIACWRAESPEAAREIGTQLDPHSYAARARELAETIFDRWCRMVEKVREQQ